MLRRQDYKSNTIVRRSFPLFCLSPSLRTSKLKGYRGSVVLLFSYQLEDLSALQLRLADRPRDPVQIDQQSTSVIFPLLFLRRERLGRCTFQASNTHASLSPHGFPPPSLTTNVHASTHALTNGFCTNSPSANSSPR